MSDRETLTCVGKHPVELSQFKCVADVSGYIENMIRQALEQRVFDSRTAQDDVAVRAHSMLRELAGEHADLVQDYVEIDPTSGVFFLKACNLFTTLLCRGIKMPDDQVNNDTYTDEHGAVFTLHDDGNLCVKPATALRYVSCTFDIARSGECTPVPLK